MPLYDYECEKCKKIFDDYKPVDEREYSTCPDCKGRAKKIFTLSNFNFSIFHDYVDYHIGSEPVHIKSKEHKKQILKENGLSEL